MTQNNYNPDVLTCLANLSNDEVFTPPSVVNAMLDLLPPELWSDPNATFLDPVSKTGVFLREMAKRLMEGLVDKIPDQQERINHIFTRQLFALPITSLTALVSRRSVYCSKTANGKYSVCSEFVDEQGNIRFTPTRHTWNNGKCVFCGASESVFGNRSEDLESHAYQFIHTQNPENIFNMKFDVIIGNPPYQLEDGGNGSSARPIYQLFVKTAKSLNPRYLVMIMPSRWFAGGKGLDSFREEMLNDKQIRYIKDFVNAKDCFPNNSIGGGVCYFLWEKGYEGMCDFTTVINGVENQQLRNLSEFNIFVRYNDALDIIRKTKTTKYVSDVMLSRNPYGIPSYTRGKKTAYKNSVLLNTSQGTCYVDKTLVTQNIDYLDKYKIMLSKVTVEHAGEPDKNGQVRLLSSIKVMNPNEVCTDSYLSIGKFDTYDEANNFCNYLKTKFARILLLQAVSSINLSKDKFQFVPLQDFSEAWTDEKLYKKYNLTADEIAFIESMIRPME